MAGRGMVSAGLAAALGAGVAWFGIASSGMALAASGEVAAGARIAREACLPCHAIGATGASPKAEAPVFRELGRKYPVEALEEALAEGVVVGHPEMPEVKMSEREIADFIAWLKTIQDPAPAK